MIWSVVTVNPDQSPLTLVPVTQQADTGELYMGLPAKPSPVQLEQQALGGAHEHVASETNP